MTEDSNPYFREQQFLTDLDRLIGMLESEFEAKYTREADVETDYMKLMDIIGGIIGSTLGRGYQKGQPGITVYELNPQIIVAEGTKKFADMCQEFGVTERSYWFFAQTWLRYNILKSCIAVYLEDEGVIDETELGYWVKATCGAFLPAVRPDA